MKPVWTNKNILLKTKLTIFNSNVKSVLLYGSETRKHTKALASKLQVFVNTYDISSVLYGLTLFPMKNSGKERNRDQFQKLSRSGNGGGLDKPYDRTQPASHDRHSTGTPKGSACDAVKPRLGEEL